jgi:hypothetical protein
MDRLPDVEMNHERIRFPEGQLRAGTASGIVIVI